MENMYVYMYTHVCMYIYTCIYHMKSRLGQSIETEGRLVAAQGWAGRVGVYQLRGIGSLFFFFLIIYLFFFIYGCVGSSFLCEGFFQSRQAGSTLHRGARASHYRGLSRRAGSAVVAHGPSRSAACGILPDQGSNPCPLHWQADSQPLRHQGSPRVSF